MANLKLQKPIQSGLMNRPAMVDDRPKMSKEEVKALIERMKAYDAEMVTGIFENREAPGQGLRFSICLYGEEYEVYELFDGERYRIPRGVARHLNNGCASKEYASLNQSSAAVNNAEILGATGISDGRYIGGNNYMKPVSKKYRCSFKSLEFSDDTIDSFQSSLFLPEVDKVLPKIF